MKKDSILPEDWSSKIGRLQISTKSKLRGQHKGSHRSMRFGSSLDFSDFREYHPGDDVRQIDWNVFARTNKYFIKRFLDEQEMRVHILLDSTKSMQEEKKWLLAKQLTISLGHLVLGRDDRLSFATPTEEKLAPFRRKGAVYRKAFSSYITNLSEPNMNTSFTNHAAQYSAKDCTVLFIITDGLEPIADWERCLRSMPRFSQDIRLIIIQSSDEVAPQFSGDLQLVDCETNDRLNVTVSSRIVEDYEKKRHQHFQELDILCRRFGIHTLKVETRDDISHILFHQMIRSNWIN
ncbi:DUF58 domain-containing protein [Paenisporosarcina quisquiliarum]|uniref:DUF58 domain-containing protein n=1 Tax=Paenisporosarcina quisquiliarum TaxID=365346 RepID=A0A9X3RDJ6_9BACL|nr:DUF58 domain-containing protein [Paenisporosarcina quisquiliarum]MCZ8536477.1 DUF58 domain-containing protein [Paenisporosarcina quisquiliarum]